MKKIKMSDFINLSKNDLEKQIHDLKLKIAIEKLKVFNSASETKNSHGQYKRQIAVMKTALNRK
jgi:ribosomal protein L29